MVTAEFKNKMLEAYEDNVFAMIDSAEGDYNLDAAMGANNSSKVKDIVTKVHKAMIANVPDELDVPKVSLYVSSTGSTPDTISLVNITLGNKITASKDFKFTTVVTSGNAIQKVIDFMMGVYKVLLVDELIEQNLTRVNEVLKSATDDAKCGFEIEVVSPLSHEGKKIASISDDKIAFVADEARAFTLDTILVLLEEATEIISEDVIKAHYAKLVEELETVQSTVQLVNIHGGALVAYVCDISKRVKPFTLIKKVTSKNVSNVKGTAPSEAYYSDGKVFALVGRKENSPWEMVLSPFDTETLVKSDTDVLAVVNG